LIFDCEKALIAMKKAKSGPIDVDKVDTAIKIINEFIVNNELI
jgi:hypothetical protein